MKHVRLMALMALVCLQPGKIYAKTAKEIAASTLPSVVTIYTTNKDGDTVVGSGFFIMRNVVVTNHHVIEDAQSGRIEPFDGVGTKDITNIIAFDKGNDLALIEVDDAETAPLKVATSNEVSVGDKIYVAGSPSGLSGTFTDGLVSSVRGSEESSVLQISAPISKGSSGGPVLNVNGEVIGISFALIRKGQNLNFAIPSNYLLGLVGRARIRGVVPKLENASLTTTSETPHEPSDTAKAGMGFLFLFVILGVHTLWLGICLQQMKSRSSAPAFWRWLPVLNLAVLCDVAGHSRVFVMWLMLPFVNVLFWAYMWASVARSKSMSSAWGWLCVFPGLSLFLAPYISAKTVR